MFLKILQYLPTLVTVIEAITKLVDALKSKAEAQKKSQNSEIEDKVILKQKAKLIEVGRGFLNQKQKDQVSQDELENFSTKLLTAAEAAWEAFEAFMPLMK